MSAGPNWGYLHRLRPEQIVAVRERAPIAYVPWGALEWHSVHCPVGLDGMVAEECCRLLAGQTGGIVLPTVYHATSTIRTMFPFPHTIEHRESTVAALCEELCEGLIEDGFRVIILLTGHCGEPHYSILKKTAAAMTARHDRVRVEGFTEMDFVDESIAARNHAARGETSLQMAVDPELVDLTALPPDRAPTLEKDGVWGDDPRAASAVEGRHILEAFVRAAAEEVRRTLRAVESTL